MEKIKILGIIGDNNQSASKKFRVEIPLKALEGKIINVGGEDKVISCDFINTFDPPLDVLENYNIIWNNMGIFTKLAAIGYLQAKGIKFVQDVDDFYLINREHIMYKNYAEGYKAIPVISATADITICATDRLAYHMQKFSNLLCVNYNDLPLGEEQFIVKDKIKRKGKVHLGVVGSSSHLPDYKSIKNAIKKICNDKELQKSCKFVIYGYTPSNKVWEDIASLFTTNKDFEVDLLPGVDINSYMEIYDNVDILLAPLSDVEFNACKSSLKIMEASLRNIPVIASPLYANKEVSGVIVAKTDNMWVKNIKTLLFEDNYLKYGKELSEKNREGINFEGRIEHLKKVIEHISNLKKDVLPENLKIFSIKYDESQVVEYEPFMNTNTETPWRFEYEAFINILKDLNDYKGYLGILSWKFLLKSGIPKKLLINLTRDTINKNEIDIINLSPKHWKDSEEYLKFSYEQHPGLEEILKLVLIKLGVKYTDKLPTVVYSNQFIMKVDVYKDYLTNWILPSLDYMENEIWDMVNKDANYTGGISQEELKKRTNLDFFNFVTFTLERLVLFYIKEKNLKVKQI